MKRYLAALFAAGALATVGIAGAGTASAAPAGPDHKIVAWCPSPLALCWG